MRICIACLWRHQRHSSLCLRYFRWCSWSVWHLPITAVSATIWCCLTGWDLIISRRCLIPKVFLEVPSGLFWDGRSSGRFLQLSAIIFLEWSFPFWSIEREQEQKDSGDFVLFFPVQCRCLYLFWSCVPCCSRKVRSTYFSEILDWSQVMQAFRFLQMRHGREWLLSSSMSG